MISCINLQIVVQQPEIFHSKYEKSSHEYAKVIKFVLHFA